MSDFSPNIRSQVVEFVKSIENTIPDLKKEKHNEDLVKLILIAFGDNKYALKLFIEKFEGPTKILHDKGFDKINKKRLINVKKIPSHYKSTIESWDKFYSSYVKLKQLYMDATFLSPGTDGFQLSKTLDPLILETNQRIKGIKFKEKIFFDIITELPEIAVRLEDEIRPITSLDRSYGMYLLYSFLELESLKSSLKNKVIKPALSNRLFDKSTSKPRKLTTELFLLLYLNYTGDNISQSSLRYHLRQGKKINR